MQHVTDFPALPPAKAKAAALALFSSAATDPTPDWRAVAFALHAAFVPKAKAAPVIEADGFEPWEDYATTRAAMKKAMGGRVIVTFADGWSRSVNITRPAGKAWRIAAAVRFAITCWRLAAIRLLTGSDSALYHTRADGLETALDGLVACPPVASIVSDDGQDTEAGALRWNPDTANRETADYRAGRVTIPLEMGEEKAAIVAEIQRQHDAMVAALGGNSRAVRQAMAYRTMATATRLEAFLYPKEPGTGRLYRTPDCHPFGAIIAGEPLAYPMEAARREDIEACGMRYIPDSYGLSIEMEDGDAPVPEIQPATDPEPVADATPEALPEPATAEEPPAPVIPPAPSIVSQDSDGKWSEMEEHYPDHVAVISMSHRANEGYGVARVIGLPYPQSGCVRPISDMVSGVPKGCRISGPRAATKRLKLETERYQVCTTAADVIVHGPDIDFTRDRFVDRHDLDYLPNRRALMADALYAFGFEGDAGLATGKVRRNLSSYWAWHTLMEPRGPMCDAGRTIKQCDLEAAFPPLTVIQNPAPLALPAPAPVLLLTGPKVKPRYSVGSDGVWRKIAA
jgi:hypothetical protein